VRLFYYLDLHRIEIKNCAQVQEACDARLFVLPKYFTLAIQRKDSSHAVFFSFGNVSTFRKDGFVSSKNPHHAAKKYHLGFFSSSCEII